MQKYIFCKSSAQNRILHYDFSMLLSFRCKNFRSFREEQEFSFIAAKTRTDEKSESLIDTPFEGVKLLRCAAIYGHNASGKSNILDALSSLRRIVSDSWRTWNPTGPIPVFDPYLLDESSREANTEFELTFLLDSEIYRYGFQFNQQAIQKETLVNATDNDKILFQRSSEFPNVRFPNKNLSKTPDDRRHLESIEREVRPNSLFLSAAAQKAHPLLSRIYAYLSDSFKAMHWKNMSGRQQYTAEMCSDASIHDQILAMIRFADAGISDLEVSKRDLPENARKALSRMVAVLGESGSEESTPPQEFPTVREVRMAHRGKNGKTYLLGQSKESDGTQAYFSALGPILNALRTGTVLLVDELESSLHTKLAFELVRIFNSPELNRNGAQFIFTTHNTNLLDLDLLRRDQIWFTEKDREGATKLYPLTDYQPRTNQNIEAGYLGGRFGAIPILDESILKETLKASEGAQSSLEFPAEI